MAVWLATLTRRSDIAHALISLIVPLTVQGELAEVAVEGTMVASTPDLHKFCIRHFRFLQSICLERTPRILR